ncbi:hypothetical protein U0070_002096 [Myodes glareolus]|uniref:Uncharacterized protein n=1 Tax=Myodes glareolus TaxID=447135 RepID=A0AAW0H5A5_MYOGA
MAPAEQQLSVWESGIWVPAQQSMPVQLSLYGPPQQKASQHVLPQLVGGMKCQHESIQEDAGSAHLDSLRLHEFLPVAGCDFNLSALSQEEYRPFPFANPGRAAKTRLGSGLQFPGPERPNMTSGKSTVPRSVAVSNRKGRSSTEVVHRARKSNGPPEAAGARGPSR